jgi:hypothetical protein
MTSVQLYDQISALPEDLRQEVTDFIEFLLTKRKKSRKVRERQFGIAPGFITISDDFDEPLEDFREYMQ